MLEAKNLSRHFGHKVALNALNLKVNPGQILCLLGANGAGKTTTINLFLGFLEPTSGTAWINGINVAEDPNQARGCLAYVPEQVSLYPTLTGMENLIYFSRLANKGKLSASHLRGLLQQVALDPKAADIRVESYSKGMRQKIGLAIALAKGARVLLLDEPLSGLDPKAANEFCTLIRQLADNTGTAILMATHDLFRAKEVGDQVGIMKSGQLVALMNTDNLDHEQLEQIYLDHMQDATT